MAQSTITRRTAASLIASVAASGAVKADGTAVDLQLVLAVDVSGSVNARRFELQKQGYVKAFRTKQILDAIKSGAAGAIAVTMAQWTGPVMQVVVVPWTRIYDDVTFEAFAAAVERGPRHLYSGGTSISGAIDHAMSLFPACPYPSQRRVIDVSGDGENNRGRSSDAARDDAVDKGVGINGLPILEIERELDQHYRDHVIGGPGSFLIAAETFEAFADAVRRKLILEISGMEGIAGKPIAT
jgi:Protein of unknown function (DUF1194)